MRNFIILFEEKEGTSPFVRLLDHFEKISVVHQINDSGWEPFDQHNCGRISLGDLERCLDMVYGRQPIDFDRLNAIYNKTAKKALEPIVGEGLSIGFKMRYWPPAKNLSSSSALTRSARLSSIFGGFVTRQFHKMMKELIKRHNLVVLFAVRQDVLRWGLSKYHGDGTGKAEHLQFKLAAGQISKDELGKINVDCERFDEIVAECEASPMHANVNLLKISSRRAFRPTRCFTKISSKISRNSLAKCSNILKLRLRLRNSMPR